MSKNLILLGALASALLGSPIEAQQRGSGRDNPPPQRENPPQREKEREKPQRETPPARETAPAQGNQDQRELEVRIDNALGAFQRRVTNAEGIKDPAAVRAAYDELVTSLRAGYTAMQSGSGTADARRTRLQNAVDDLLARAKNGALQQKELDLLRVQLLEDRLENALTKLETRAANAGERGQLERVEAWLTELTNAAMAVDPESGNVRTRVASMIEELKKKATVSAADLAPIRTELAGARAQRWTSILEQRATSRTSVPLDFTRTKDAVSDYTDELAKTDPSARDLQKRLANAIDGLATRAASGEITREQFNELKAQLTARARAAASPR